ncbi:MAG: DUF2244 domain-containing protein, partial [Rhodospirillales bacterium]
PVMTLAAETVLFNTTLRPHRSANLYTLRWLLILMALAFAITGFGFSLAGAWPVSGFLGLEIVLLVGALLLNERAGRAVETISLTADALTVHCIDARGRERRFTFPPQWLQIVATPVPHGLLHEGGGLERLEVRSHGRSVAIGSFLPPADRQALCADLRTALARFQLNQGLN